MEKSERKLNRKRIMSWALAFFMTMSAVDVSGWGSIAAHAEEAVSVGAFDVRGYEGYRLQLCKWTAYDQDRYSIDD